MLEEEHLSMYKGRNAIPDRGFDLTCGLAGSAVLSRPLLLAKWAVRDPERVGCPRVLWSDPESDSWCRRCVVNGCRLRRLFTVSASKFGGAHVDWRRMAWLCVEIRQGWWLVADACAAVWWLASDLAGCVLAGVGDAEKLRFGGVNTGAGMEF